MKLGPSFGDAMQMDQALYQLAAYDVSRGLILIPETADQAVDMQKGIAKRFNYFKRLIQNSEVSFAELQRGVVDRNGPYPSKTHNMTPEQVIDNIINPKEEEEEEAPRDPRDPSVLLKRLFEDILHMSGQDAYLINGNDQVTRLDEEEGKNPFLLSTTEPAIDSNTSDNRVLPKMEKKESKSPKGKNGRSTKSKTDKSKTDENSEGKKDT